MAESGPPKILLRLVVALIVLGIMVYLTRRPAREPKPIKPVPAAAPVDAAPADMPQGESPAKD